MINKYQPKLTMGLTTGGFDRFLIDGGGIDFRLNEPCWQELSNGDVFEFLEDPDEERRYCVRILHLYKADCFANLIDDLPNELFDVKKKDLYLDFFAQWWTLEQEQRDGVLGIYLSVIQDSISE